MSADLVTSVWLRPELRRKRAVLRLWDFDDTLAASEAVFDAEAARRPDVALYRWWHEPALSVPLALRTPPIPAAWELLRSMRGGEDWILTARCIEAPIAWLRLHADSPGVRRIARVTSTSIFARKHLPGAQKKAALVRFLVEGGREVHVYDDRIDNLDACARAGATPHRVVAGRLV